MENDRLIQLAEEYCSDSHGGQFRKGNGLPYKTHPFAVADILNRFEPYNAVRQCITLLHDTIEDTDVITGEIKDEFGYEIANGVFILSKNTIYDETIKSMSRALGIDMSGFSIEQIYKNRLSFARETVKKIKIADMIDNTQDLHASWWSASSRERKIFDAQEFYIPMGRDISPLMVKELEKNISNYLSSIE